MPRVPVNSDPTKAAILMPINRIKKKKSSGRNAYLATIRNPLISGVKIPDPFSMQPTATMQMNAEFMVTGGLASNNNNIVAIALDPVNMKYTVSSTASTPAAITWPSSAAAFPGRATAIALYSSWRVVSACIDYYFIGNDTGNAGLAIGAQLDQHQYTLPTNLPTNIVSITTDPNKDLRPSKFAGRIIWRPTDNADVEFHSFSNESPISFLALTALADNASFQIRIIANYEGIASNDNISIINPTPSPDVPTLYTQAKSWLASTPFAITAPTAVAAGSMYGVGRSIRNTINDFNSFIEID